MELGGLPLHPLVIHGAVVLTPLAALASIVFAVVPRWRWLSRWPAALLTLAATGAVVAAKYSGESLLDSRPELAPLVKVHQQRGDLLMWFMIGFLVVMAAAVYLLSGTTPLPSGRGARNTRVAVLDKVLPVVVVLAALVVLVLVILTGDAGSRAVWG